MTEIRVLVIPDEFVDDVADIVARRRQRTGEDEDTARGHVARALITRGLEELEQDPMEEA